LTGQPLLTGASLAGALRNYLREYDGGFGQAETHAGQLRVEQLFGYLHARDKSSVQSWLMVDDAVGQPAGIELRDGVTIDAKTRTAEDGKKYDVELLSAGTTFPLRLELWLTEKEQHSDELLAALVVALRGLTVGEITLGQRKRRGYGQCHVSDWRTRRYSMKTVQGLLDWLEDKSTTEMAGLPEIIAGPDARRELRITATFRLDGSLLIRSGSGLGNSPDMVHLRSKRQAGDQPVLAGTSAAGVMRGRALRIANTVLGRAVGQQLIDSLFGRRITASTDQPTGSRVSVRETDVKHGTVNLIQSRVKIDRFTGGSYPSALFSQQPVWSAADGDTTVQIDMSLRQSIVDRPGDFEAQAGLLLLVLKDLWTGDLPLGGESSVGRGRLIGHSAELTYADQQWTLTGSNPVEVTGTGSKADLERWVAAIQVWAPPTQTQEAKHVER
jgi:CRISPR/Cas system CSM-associated protein Csm3 (group 7 of RAMP superfamily)